MEIPYIRKLDNSELFSCEQTECFEWATIYVEGGFYCAEHGKVVIDMVKGE